MIDLDSIELPLDGWSEAAREDDAVTWHNERGESLMLNVFHVMPDIPSMTDLEALHPFLRIGAIESQLQGQFHVPTVFLYPGIRTGKTRLKFLGFYPEDGNYRSVHIGG